VNLPAGLGAQLGEGFDEALALRRVPEDWLAPVTAIHDVADRTGDIDAEFVEPCRPAAQHRSDRQRQLCGSAGPAFMLVLIARGSIN
jgi:hypothetical protein